MAGDFNSGLAVGIGCGMAMGMGSGLSLGLAIAHSQKKERKQLESAIEDQSITVVAKGGQELTAEQLFELLEKRKNGLTFS